MASGDRVNKLKKQIQGYEKVIDGVLDSLYRARDEVISNEEFPTGEILKIIQERSSQEISNDLQSAYQTAILKDKVLNEYPEKIKVVLGIAEE